MTTTTTQPTTMPAQPTVEQVLAGMAAQVGGHLPRMVELAATVMPEMVLKHAQDGGFAMPKEGRRAARRDPHAHASGHRSGHRQPLC